MNGPLRILIAEDSPADVELLLRELRRASFALEWEVVDNEPDFVEHLRPDLDLVLSDYDMPQFTGLRALEILRQRDPDLPFIIVSGTIGEDLAVSVMREGATDYVLKSQLGRLGLSVRQALDQARLRREGRLAARARLESEQALRELSNQLEVERARLVAAQAVAKVGSWETDLTSLSVIWSDETYRIFGIEGEETAMSHEMFLEKVHPEDRAAVDLAFRDSFGTTDPCSIEHRILLPDGAVKYVEERWKVFMDAQGKPQRAFGTCQDVSERRARDEALRSSLGEKEALLREVHHRVKNNLQVITSLLRLEAARTSADDARRVLKEMQGRIFSMALLHETLYRTGNFRRVDLAAYLSQLATQLFRSQNANPGAVRLVASLTPVEVELDQAIPCGLIVNELLANALKHGFRDGVTGEARLSLTVEHDKAVVVVTDTGAGLATDFEARRQKSLGLQLAADLARQIQGEFRIGPGPVARFTATFPIWTTNRSASGGTPGGQATP